MFVRVLRRGWLGLGRGTGHAASVSGFLLKGFPGEGRGVCPHRRMPGLVGPAGSMAAPGSPVFGVIGTLEGWMLKPT